jgi:ubiquinone/menaquinone biosynthesis C-methylase UbiE
MTSSTRLSTIASIYNRRAPNYDNEGGFHPAQAADFIKWMDIRPGYRVLDLACGTGAITIPAARIVGPSGKVYGIDISGDSLSIARSKAEREGLDSTSLEFLEHDIAALDELGELEEGSFDVISCASAFVLFEDPENVVGGWKKMLKTGGKMIFDVPIWNRFVFSCRLSEWPAFRFSFFPFSTVQVLNDWGCLSETISFLFSYGAARL